MRPAASHRDSSPITLEHAVEAFVRGFTFTRSFTHPYLPQRVGGVWVARDAPRTNGAYRNEEWIAHGVAPAEIDRLAKAHTRGRFSPCPIVAAGEDDAPLRRQFKALGYRLSTTQPLMVHSLRRIGRFDSPATIQRVTRADLAQRLAKAARGRPLLPEHLDVSSDPPIRVYVALIDSEIVGWVRSVAAGDLAWCASMFVVARHRRRGIARAMLSRMLADDRKSGAQAGVLLASHTGAKLYAAAGYQQIGTLLLYHRQK
jgi:GNAT superfamily N-acetyltransferase